MIYDLKTDFRVITILEYNMKYDNQWAKSTTNIHLPISLYI